MNVATANSTVDSSVVRHKIPGGTVLIHPPTEDCSWRLDRDNPNSFLPHIDVAKGEGVNTLYMPIPDFKGKIAHNVGFKEEISSEGFRVMGKKYGDVFYMLPGTAYGLTTADCPTIIVCVNGRILTIHAGRDSLIDTEVMKSFGTKNGRRHFSAIDIAMFLLESYGCKAPDMRIYVFCGISAENFGHSFDHPQYGEQNEFMINHLAHKYGHNVTPGFGGSVGSADSEKGYLDMFELIVAQFNEYGVTRDQIERGDDIDTASDNDYASNRDGDESRNYVCVISDPTEDPVE